MKNAIIQSILAIFNDSIISNVETVTSVGKSWRNGNESYMMDLSVDSTKGYGIFLKKNSDVNTDFVKGHNPHNLGWQKIPYSAYDLRIQGTFGNIYVNGELIDKSLEEVLKDFFN